MIRPTLVIAFLTVVSFTSFLSCTQHKQTDYITYGESKLVADESLFPIVDDEYEVFSSRYKQAEIVITYLPEQDIVNHLLSDSFKVAVMSRLLTDSEKQYFDKKKITVKSTKFAIDGIALITGKNNPDSLITLTEIKDAFQGRAKKMRTFVFDNPKSSTVSYLMAVTGVKEFPKNVYALKTNKEVIQYVTENPLAIGIVSVAWMKRPTPDIAQQIEELKFMGVKGSEGTFEKPSQSNLKLNKYPLTRDLYLINCQGRAGLGTGFASFLASEIGQRIILKSGLAPDSLPTRQIRFRN